MNRETRIWLGVIAGIAIVSGGVFAVRSLNQPAPPEPLPPQPGAAIAIPDGGEVAPEVPAEVAPVLGLAPQFQLTDQAGQAFGTPELKDRIWIANFIFTRCAATCPAQTRVMADLQKLLSASPIWSDVRLLSISVDPEYDQPGVLQEYATATGADNEHWRFLTGERGQIWDLSKTGFRLAVEDDAKNSAMPIMHDSKFVLVDRRSNIRGYFDVLNADGLTNLRRALDHVLPEMTISDDKMTHLAQPPEIVSNDWLDERQASQTAAIQTATVFHGFQFRNQLAESGIDFDPQIVDEQRWRLQVNHYDHGNGVAIADVDGDGRLDLYFVAQAGSNGLYRNLGGGKFENITETAGVGVADRIGVTASFADIDNDSDSDLFVTTVRGGNLLFENDGKGIFRDITREAGVEYVGHSSAAVFFDFNRDGLLDLFLTNVGKYTTDEFASLRIDGTSSLPAGDYKYYVGTPDAFAGHLKPDHSESSILYKNLGERKFADVSQEVDLADTSWSGAASPLDVNEDGWLDLYVLNMQGDDEYYENVAGERFVRKSREVFPRTPWGSMGVKSFDFNNDGRFDLYITDMHSDMSTDVGPSLEKQKSDMQWPEAFLRSTPEKSIFGNAFFRNDGDGKFSEISDEIGAENYWPWGLSVDDLNADGFDDVFIGASMCFPYRYAVNSVLLNEAGKRFVDSEFVLGIEPRPKDQQVKPWFELDCDGVDRDSPVCAGRTGRVTVWSARGTRSSVIFDLDDDGDLDVVTNEFNSPPQVFVSDLAEQRPVNYLKVALRGTKSNADGLGAVVTLTVGDKMFKKMYDGQSGYLSQSRMPLYFGLGESETVDKIEIRWPSGNTQVVEGPVAGKQLLEIEET
jgi:cytochrome oxidase Cu insertion factor (SCO1/SenC/PrrC family)